MKGGPEANLFPEKEQNQRLFARDLKVDFDALDKSRHDAGDDGVLVKELQTGYCRCASSPAKKPWLRPPRPILSCHS